MSQLSKQKRGLWAWGAKLHIPCQPEIKVKFRDLAERLALSQAELGLVVFEAALKDEQWIIDAVKNDPLCRQRANIEPPGAPENSPPTKARREVVVVAVPSVGSMLRAILELQKVADVEAIQAGLDARRQELNLF